MIGPLIDWLVQAIDYFGYFGIGLSIFLANFIVPIPSQILMPFSGFVASQGSLNIVLVILVASLGAYLGSLPFYFIGLWGDDFLENFLRKYAKYLLLTQEEIEKGYTAFEKYGHIIVLFGRLIPVVRSVISFPAGAARMKFWVFSVYTYLGGLLFAGILCTAGYVMGENWDRVIVYVEEYERIALALLIIAILLYIWRGMRNVVKESKKIQEQQRVSSDE